MPAISIMTELPKPNQIINSVYWGSNSKISATGKKNHIMLPLCYHTQVILTGNELLKIRSYADNGYFRSIFSIDLPFASSSTSLSRYRISCISGSSISSTRIPQTTPLISLRESLSLGAFSKNVSKLI
jgi:hypothetical protein